MNSTGHLPVSEKAARPQNKSKAKRRPRGRARASKNGHTETGKAQPAVGTLSRTKTLLLAALRVWELKHRISE